MGYAEDAHDRATIEKYGPNLDGKGGTHERHVGTARIPLTRQNLNEWFQREHRWASEIAAKGPYDPILWERATEIGRLWSEFMARFQKEGGS